MRASSSLISCSDFLPKFLVFISSASVRWTSSPMVVILAFRRQLLALTESSSSSTDLPSMPLTPSVVRMVAPCSVSTASSSWRAKDEEVLTEDER